MTPKRRVGRKVTPKIREFLGWLFDEIFEGSPDGGDIQDKAEALGLLVSVKIPQKEIDANPEKYEKCLEYETDTLLFPYWTKEARLKEVGRERD